MCLPYIDIFSTAYTSWTNDGINILEIRTYLYSCLAEWVLFRNYGCVIVAGSWTFLIFQDDFKPKWPILFMNSLYVLNPNTNLHLYFYNVVLRCGFDLNDHKHSKKVLSFGCCRLFNLLCNHRISFCCQNAALSPVQSGINILVVIISIV